MSISVLTFFDDYCITQAWQKQFIMQRVSFFLTISNHNKTIYVEFSVRNPSTFVFTKILKFAKIRKREIYKNI